MNDPPAVCQLLTQVYASCCGKRHESPLQCARHLGTDFKCKKYDRMTINILWKCWGCLTSEKVGRTRARLQAPADSSAQVSSDLAAGSSAASVLSAASPELSRQALPGYHTHMPPPFQADTSGLAHAPLSQPASRSMLGESDQAMNDIAAPLEQSGLATQSMSRAAFQTSYNNAASVYQRPQPYDTTNWASSPTPNPTSAAVPPAAEPTNQVYSALQSSSYYRNAHY